MHIRLDGQVVAVPEGLTFAQLIRHAQELVPERALVEISVDRESLTQEQLEDLLDRRIYGQIELFSFSRREVATEMARQATAFLEEAAGAFAPLTAENAPVLAEALDWLGLALRELRRDLPEGHRETIDRIVHENQRWGLELKEASQPGHLQKFQQLRRELPQHLGNLKTLFGQLKVQL